tara:strand:- start:284 stop:628 length:345 start_codon:yes stop_codon:yes gene_type:complete
MIKKLLWFILDCWRLVMDSRYNPLRHIKDPSIQAYFTLVLFIMWSGYFGMVAGHYLGWYGYDIVWSIIIHCAIVVPLLVTNQVFKDAERNGMHWGKQRKIFMKSDIEYRDGDNT